MNEAIINIPSPSDGPVVTLGEESQVLPAHRLFLPIFLHRCFLGWEHVRQSYQRPGMDGDIILWTDAGAYVDSADAIKILSHLHEQATAAHLLRAWARKVVAHMKDADEPDHILRNEGDRLMDLFTDPPAAEVEQARAGMPPQMHLVPLIEYPSDFHDVWIEGYSATGEHATASYIGTCRAASFDEAVIKLVGRDQLDKIGDTDELRYQSGRLSSWCMRYFNNEADARKSFG